MWDQIDKVVAAGYASTSADKKRPKRFEECLLSTWFKWDIAYGLGMLDERGLSLRDSGTTRSVSQL